MNSRVLSIVWPAAQGMNRASRSRSAAIRASSARASAGATERSSRSGRTAITMRAEG